MEIYAQVWRGNPILVLTENGSSPNNTDSHYTYYRLQEIKDIKEAHLLADLYNSEFKLPCEFGSIGSVELLTRVQIKFPLALILNDKHKSKLFSIKVD